jgi:hypothetical protein
MMEHKDHLDHAMGTQHKGRLYVQAWARYRQAKARRKTVVHQGIAGRPGISMLRAEEGWWVITPARFDESLATTISGLPQQHRWYVKANLRERLRAGWLIDVPGVVQLLNAAHEYTWSFLHTTPLDLAHLQCFQRDPG